MFDARAPAAEVPLIPKRDIHVYMLRADEAVITSTERLEELISSCERDNASRFHFADDANAYKAAHWLLRVALHRHTGIHPASFCFTYTTSAKPTLKPEPELKTMVSFSLSHIRGFVGSAIASEAEIGFDIEQVKETPDLKGLMLTTLTDAELSGTESLTAENLQRKSFFTHWVLKESIIKATGLGLAIEPRNISLSPCRTAARIFDSSVGPQFEEVDVLGASDLAIGARL